MRTFARIVFVVEALLGLFFLVINLDLLFYDDSWIRALNVALSAANFSFGIFAWCDLSEKETYHGHKDNLKAA